MVMSRNAFIASAASASVMWSANSEVVVPGLMVVTRMSSASSSCDWAADLFARSDLIQTKCCWPKIAAAADAVTVGGPPSPQAAEASSGLST